MILCSSQMLWLVAVLIASIVLYLDNQYNETSLNQSKVKFQLAAELDPAQPHLVVPIFEMYKVHNPNGQQASFCCNK